MNVRSSVQINRPASVVFSFITDPRNYALWHSGFLGVEVTPHGPLQVGWLFRFRTRIFMKEFETVTEFREVHLGKRLVYRGISGPFAYTGSYIMDSSNGGTVVTWVLDGETQGFFGMAEPALSKMAEMKLGADLEKIKEVLESEGGEVIDSIAYS